MAQSGIRARADRAITQRQIQEKIHETKVAHGVDQTKAEQKALWENRMDDVIRGNRMKTKVGSLQAQRQATLQERRSRLAALLSEEQRAYEREMVESEETPAQRMEKMAQRAYDLKKRREDERKQVVQDKLYQQWRDGIDELRTQDSKIVELKTIAARDAQLDEKELKRQRDNEETAMFDALWAEGYRAKVEREEREKGVKKERNEVAKETLNMQLEMKDQRLQVERENDAVEREVMKKLWESQELEEKEKIVRDKILAKQERAETDKYAAVQREQREAELAEELQQDKDFVQGVLEREHRLQMQEDAEKVKAKQKAVEYTEALKIEMARKAESEEQLLQLQAEEAERQWQKRYAQWEKEELARRGLMEEVYSDRGEQVRLKQEVRSRLKDEIVHDRTRIDAEVKRLEAIESDRVAAEELVRHKHQEELFRQMDFHQVQRHRQLQQHAIEQRQAAIAEEKLRRAVEAEKRRGAEIKKTILIARDEAQKASETLRKGGQVTAPWDK